MHSLKYKIGQYQKLWQVRYLLGRRRSPGSSGWQPISLSSVNANSKEREEDAFGSLQSDFTSQFYERGREKRHEENVENTSKKSHFERKTKFQGDGRHKEFGGRKATSFPSEYKASFDERVTLDKWNKQKHYNIEKLSKNLVEDDREEEYFWHYSHEPKYIENMDEEGKQREKTKKMSQNIIKDGSVIEPQVDSIKFQKPSSPPIQSKLDDDPLLPMFGTLSPQKDLYEDEEGDEGDECQRKYEEAKLERRHRPAFYGNKMKQLCKERKLVDALKILEEEMPSVGAKPDEYCYQVLINACGRAGYTKKAFQLYNGMKKRGLQPQPVTYTGLFNACAESPWPAKDGLTRAHKLREQLKEKGYIVNQTISHAMIKAFGRCGDIKTAFQIVDEMLQQGLLVTTETICFMLQACISDKENGFRHALLVWRKMRELRLMPTIYAYNLLMRCVGSCGAGVPALTTQLLEAGSESTRNTPKNNKENSKKKTRETNMNTETVSAGDSVTDELVKEETVRFSEGFELQVLSYNYKLESDQTILATSKELLPNLLGKRLTKGCAVGLTSLDRPENRLALLGGPAGIFRQMERDKVTPDLATATQMIDSLPSNPEAEESLLQSMKNVGLTPDTQFCNKLILKRCYRHDIDAAKDVLNIMQTHHLVPDIITFGCLAHGCKTLYLAIDFLKDMKTAGFRPNLEIFTTLVKHSIRREDYYFLIRILEEMSKENLSPDKFLLDHMEKARSNARELIIKMESRPKKHQDEDQRKQENAQLFLMKYKSWLKSSKLELQNHPWAQYKYAKSIT